MYVASFLIYVNMRLLMDLQMNYCLVQNSASSEDRFGGGKLLSVVLQEYTNP